MHILLLAGGTSNERDVSLRSGKAVADALSALGYSFTVADPGAKDFNLTDHLEGIDAVFLALHGKGGEDGTLQAILEANGIPFVGSDSKSSALCFDKWEYKKLLQQNGLPATGGWKITEEDIEQDFFAKPYVLKPFHGGSSLDTQIVRSPDTASKQASLNLLKQYSVMLLEPLIEGMEITIGILDKTPLPVIEIIPPSGKEFDYENKYNGATQELCPPLHVSEDLQKQAQSLALRIHELTGCRHMSRTDIIIDNNNNMHVLETNTIPGMTTESLLPKMAREAGYSMAEFVDTLIKLALGK